MPFIYYRRESDVIIQSFFAEMPTGKAQADVTPSRTEEDKGETSSLEASKSNYEKPPDYLKSCLDCCSFFFFPNGYYVGKEKLVMLLLAQGLIPGKPGEIMEDTAKIIINELIGLRMLQVHYPFKSRIEVSEFYRKLCLLEVEEQDFDVEVLLVLNLTGEVEYLPDELGDLVHLRPKAGLKGNLEAVGVPTSVPVRVARELLLAGYRYLDVRIPEEFSAGHVVEATNIPTSNLLLQGYTAITDVPSGFAAWTHNRLPTENRCKTSISSTKKPGENASISSGGLRKETNSYSPALHAGSCQIAGTG
ncbi:hypothetical protein GH714_016415 [Hevea brasiliensis]|uniref:Rhodanese domain-containing protein n=1 Tax=Hevea brasiliensis TaxID=3981 RepID=A0A6A6M0J8_HEVBR|nr:hypothetical protein GH714_016415 [Hevea brasiliensis]